MKTILVVDDEMVLTDILRDVLQDAGYRVVTAADGRAGLDSLPKVRPDLVLCDVMMPIVDGRELCRLMHADPQYRNIPLVMMTAAPGSINPQECDYAALIGKPFDLDHVLTLIESLVGAPV
ncbi:MAG: response regulator [Chloroflexota bacterium]|nr:response regulator [Chloroflexota bacterium]